MSVPPLGAYNLVNTPTGKERTPKAASRSIRFRSANNLILRDSDKAPVLAANLTKVLSPQRVACIRRLSKPHHI